MKRTEWAFLILRLVVGLSFIYFGGQKLFGLFGGPGFQGWSGFVQGMGSVPSFLKPLTIYLVPVFEFFGGLFVLVGFLTRWSALALSLVMVGAIIFVNLPKGFFNPQGGGWVLPLAFLAMSLAILLGEHRYTLDESLFKGKGESGSRQAG